MARLRVCSWNVGDGSSKSDLAEVLSWCDVVALQEMGDRDAYFDKARDLGWKTLDGSGKSGQRSTPLFYDPDVLDFKAEIEEKLSDAQHVNPGAGPEDIKTKWAIGGQFHYPGAENALRIVSCHLVASSSSGEREQLAKKQIGVLSKLWGDVDGVCFIGGDFNMGHDNPKTQPMRDRGWKCAHNAEGGPCKTKGDGTIDHVWMRPGENKARVVDQYAKACGSDHKAYVVTYEWDDHPGETY